MIHLDIIFNRKVFFRTVRDRLNAILFLSRSYLEGDMLIWGNWATGRVAILRKSAKNLFYCPLLNGWRLIDTSYNSLLLWSQSSSSQVKEITGLGTTIDVILVNGYLHEGQHIVIAGQDRPIVTQIRGLLMPQPMKELRVKNPYSKFKTVQGAQGVKIIAKDLEKALAGLPLFSSEDQYEQEVYCEEVSRGLKSILKGIQVSEKGVYVQASTLGSLEALLEFLRTSKIPVSLIFNFLHRFFAINLATVHSIIGRMK